MSRKKCNEVDARASHEEHATMVEIEKTQSSRIVLVIANRIFALFTRAASLVFEFSSTRMLILSGAIFVTLSGCAKHKQARTPAQPPKRSFQVPEEPAHIGTKEKGEASWYGEPYNGRRAASGEIFDMEQLTAAHRTLPFQTWVEVTNLDNGKRVEVRITDRGPFVDGRIIDLSRAAAREIDLLRSGIAKVELRVIEAPKILSEVRKPFASSTAPSDPKPSPSNSQNTGSPPAREGEFVVQAGAFSSRERAEALVASLLIVGEARLVASDSTPPLWRVWIGKNLTLDLATKLAEEVKALTGQAVIVRGR
jgi:rare lipoprotein A